MRLERSDDMDRPPPGYGPREAVVLDVEQTSRRVTALCAAFLVMLVAFAWILGDGCALVASGLVMVPLTAWAFAPTWSAVQRSNWALFGTAAGLLILLAT